MDVTPLIKSGTQVLQGYADGGFKVSGVRYEGAVIVMASGTRGWGVKKAFSELVLEDFQALINQADDIDVVLLGCGGTIAFLPPALRSALKEAGLSVDVMDSGAACRTYNVLVAEGRRVAAALLPVS